MSTSVPSREEAAVTLDTATIEVITGIAADVEETDLGNGDNADSGDRVAARPQILWTRPDSGLWAANYNGYYGGVVDRHGDHYFVSDTFGQYVGDFRSLDEAKERLADRLLLLLPNANRVNN